MINLLDGSCNHSISISRLDKAGSNLIAMVGKVPGEIDSYTQEKEE